jgi:hypothetical protein
MSAMHQGHVEMRATVVDVAAGSLRTRELGVVAEDDRPTGQQNARGRKGVLVVRPPADGGFPELRIEHRPL